MNCLDFHQAETPFASTHKITNFIDIFELHHQNLLKSAESIAPSLNFLIPYMMLSDDSIQPQDTQYEIRGFENLLPLNIYRTDGQSPEPDEAEEEEKGGSSLFEKITQKCSRSRSQSRTLLTVEPVDSCKKVCGSKNDDPEYESFNRILGEIFPPRASKTETPPVGGGGFHENPRPEVFDVKKFKTSREGSKCSDDSRKSSKVEVFDGKKIIKSHEGSKCSDEFRNAIKSSKVKLLDGKKMIKSFEGSKCSDEFRNAIKSSKVKLSDGTKIIKSLEGSKCSEEFRNAIKSSKAKLFDGKKMIKSFEGSKCSDEFRNAIKSSKAKLFDGMKMIKSHEGSKSSDDLKSSKVKLFDGKKIIKSLEGSKCSEELRNAIKSSKAKLFDGKKMIKNFEGSKCSDEFRNALKCPKLELFTGKKIRKSSEGSKCSDDSKSSNVEDRNSERTVKQRKNETGIIKSVQTDSDHRFIKLIAVKPEDDTTATSTISNTTNTKSSSCNDKVNPKKTYRGKSSEDSSTLSVEPLEPSSLMDLLQKEKSSQCVQNPKKTSSQRKDRKLAKATEDPDSQQKPFFKVPNLLSRKQSDPKDKKRRKISICTQTEKAPPARRHPCEFCRNSACPSRRLLASRNESGSRTSVKKKPSLRNKASGESNESESRTCIKKKPSPLSPPEESNDLGTQTEKVVPAWKRSCVFCKNAKRSCEYCKNTTCPNEPFLANRNASVSCTSIRKMLSPKKKASEESNASGSRSSNRKPRNKAGREKENRKAKGGSRKSLVDFEGEEVEVGDHKFDEEAKVKCFPKLCSSGSLVVQDSPSSKSSNTCKEEARGAEMAAIRSSKSNQKRECCFKTKTMKTQTSFNRIPPSAVDPPKVDKPEKKKSTKRNRRLQTENGREYIKCNCTDCKSKTCRAHKSKKPESFLKPNDFKCTENVSKTKSLLCSFKNCKLKPKSDQGDVRLTHSKHKVRNASEKPAGKCSKKHKEKTQKHQAASKYANRCPSACACRSKSRACQTWTGHQIERNIYKKSSQSIGTLEDGVHICAVKVNVVDKTRFLEEEKNGRNIFQSLFYTYHSSQVKPIKWSGIWPFSKFRKKRVKFS